MEPIIAWRRWRLTATDETPLALTSVYKPTVWLPRERFDARCMRSSQSIVVVGRTCSSAPTKTCHCGIYGVKDPAQLDRVGAIGEQTATRRLLVSGRVSLWGKYIEHGDGYRAQFAYPYDISISIADVRDETLAKKVARLLRSTYLVDVDVTE